MKPKIKLEEYEKICPECKGTGLTFPPLDLAELYLAICKACDGKGKINFIDNIKKGIKNEGKE